MQWKDLSLKFKLVLYIVVGISFILSASSITIISTVTDQEEQLAYHDSIQNAKSFAHQYNADMKANMAIASSLAALMVKYESADRNETNEMLKELLAENPNLIGAYVGFEPNAFDGRDAEFVGAEGHDDTGRFVPYWNTINGPISVEPLVDYEVSEYYQGPKKLKQNVVTEPYLYQGALMVSYDAPIIRNGEFVGIGGVDVSLNYVDEAVSSVKAFDTGYLFMVSNEGILLSHPINKEWIGTSSIYDFDIPQISIAADDIRNGVGGHIDTIDPATSKEVVMFYEPIETGNYAIVLVVPPEEMFAGVNSIRSDLVSIYLFSIFFMGLMAFFIASSFTNRIDEIVADFKKISGAALRGDFDARANTDVELDLNLIPKGLNEILDSLTIYSKELQNSYELISKMEAAVNSSRVVVFWWKNEEDYPVEFVSDNITQFGYSLEEFTSGKVLYGNIIHPDDRKIVWNELQACADEGKKNFHKDYRIVTKNGNIRWIHEDTYIQRDEGGSITYFQGTILDITERVEAEENLKTMEDVRTKEIHHRIKNNLQVVSGMLYLESLKFKYQEVIDSFRDSENRVRSIALIHEKLYQSKDLVSLDFADYIENLTDHLFHSYNVDKENVNLILNVEDVFLGMDTAVPLGIIINELTSNALQHAFGNGEQGDIEIDFQKDNDVFTLIISNTGTPFPEYIDFKNTESLGLQLVTNLTSQVDGEIELDKTNGTKFKITFRENR
ncbi:PAS domain-containing protein [Methanococcoides orientis]|uniref:histidine kinase dimerization/phosphoacceptor domain -containing protein n=1 Tax=Methanococcoides orientis TaxID=2822137 RepID=UPI001E4E3611|nr:histidine kinase dimerization/phosphoacceptor domain -containing protein [Methanococcoides orientis]UGV41250.1 PAS domain-containing protein [Methanococcoides orientis]